MQTFISYLGHNDEDERIVDQVVVVEHCNKHHHPYFPFADGEGIAFEASVVDVVDRGIERQQHVNPGYGMECFENIVVAGDIPNYDEVERKTSIKMFLSLQAILLASLLKCF